MEYILLVMFFRNRNGSHLLAQVLYMRIAYQQSRRLSLLVMGFYLQS